MKKKILIADKDASLKEAFRIIFSEDKYDILYAASGKEVERLADTGHPDIYIINVNLLKSSGIDVYRKLHKDKLLDNARFFFMKDENDSTELLGFQAEGVIEKPINFFKVHERIAKDDDLIVLTDEVAETQPQAVQHIGQQKEQWAVQQKEQQAARQTAQQAARQTAQQTGESATKEAAVKEEIDLKAGVEGLARELSGQVVVGTAELAPALEAELRRVLNVTMEEVVPRFVDKMIPVLNATTEEIVPRFVDRMTPVLSTFVEEYTRRVVYEIAEKIVKEEIDKLLKESTS
jgi:DNA-binding response OmpR family regulator